MKRLPVCILFLFAYIFLGGMASRPPILPPNLLFVSDNGQIFIIDRDTNQLVKTLREMKRGFVHRMGISNGKLYVPVPALDLGVGNDCIEVYDIATGSLIKKIKTGWMPDEIIIAPNGKAYIGHSFEYRPSRDYDISVIDTKTDKVIKTLKVSTRAGNFISGNDGMVYLRLGVRIGLNSVIEKDAEVVRIDPETDSMEKLFEIKLMPTIIAGISGDKAYLHSFDRKNNKSFLSVYDIRKGKEIKNISVPYGPSHAPYTTYMAFSPDGRAFIPHFTDVAYPNQGTSITVVDTNTDEVTGTLQDPRLDSPSSVLIVKDKMYVINQMSGTIAVVDIISDKIIGSININHKERGWLLSMIAN